MLAKANDKSVQRSKSAQCRRDSLTLNNKKLQIIYYFRNISCWGALEVK